MKQLLSIILIITAVSCTQKNTKDKTATESDVTDYNLDWLTGSWMRKNDDAGKKTFEQWSKRSTEEYVGLGYTLQDKDTVFKEDLRLIKINGNWNLEVTGVNENPTLFVFTDQSQNSFVCENEANEFPKKIEYVLKNKTLTATISAGDTKIPFIFEMRSSE